jgi:predicted CXXCH cytochrome family protein
VKKALPQARAGENPHFRPNRCDACHPGGRPPRLLLTGTDALCLSCHSDEANRIEVHPHGISALTGEVKKIPSDFPLIDKKLACVTCHDPLVPCKRDASVGVTDPLFLRGGPYVNPSEICFHCHDRKLYQVFNPHDQVDSRGAIRPETCLYCHEPPPPGRDKKVAGIAREPNCVSCHGIVFHPAGTDHLKKPSRKVLENMQRVTREHKLYFPLTPGGEIYCGTCHNPHEKGVLDPDSPSAAGAEGDYPRDRRLRTSPEEVCLVCHGFRPYNATPSPRGR